MRRPNLFSAGAFVLCLVAGRPARAQVLDLPPRPAGSPGGAEIAREIRTLELEARESRIFAELARGNIPAWLRTLTPVEMTRQVGFREYHVKFWVTPDYVAVGSDSDYLLVPLSPQTAQRFADRVGASLPTPPMVDAVWAAARIRLPPVPIAPGPAMTTVPVYEEHNGLVRAQRDGETAPMGALIAGHKKDVVLTAELDSRPGKVAIYGWHRLNGTPIQPLYTGHTDRWVDYSHGIRLVSRAVLIDEVKRDITEVLRDTTLARILSDEGVIMEPRYSLVRYDSAIAALFPSRSTHRAHRSEEDMDTVRMNDLVGEWAGTSRLQVTPDTPIRESPSTASVDLVAQGRFTAIRYTWADQDKPQDGLMLIASNTGKGPADVVWVDSWHMGDASMPLTNEPAEDAIVDARGTYAAPPGPAWGWRIVIRPESRDAFRLLMFNITPEGEEMLAVDATYTRKT